MSIPFTTIDTNWVEALKRNDRKAQRTVFDKLNRKMFAICHRYITDPYEAEDVLMAGFLVVFSRIDQFSGDGNFEGWIRRIMVNQSLQFLRKSKSLEALRYDNEDVSQIPASDHSSSSLDHEQLLALVQQLPMGYRMVFNLFAIEGYSHPEISNLIGISEGASKSQLHKARALLQVWVTKMNNQNLNQV